MFYGRLESYSAAMDNNDRDALATALKRNIYPVAGDSAPPMLGLADWMMVAETHLTAISEADIATGSAALPKPEQEALK
jgi:cytochrome b pre-mRNA-processing protein 3